MILELLITMLWDTKKTSRNQNLVATLIKRETIQNSKSIGSIKTRVQVLATRSHSVIIGIKASLIQESNKRAKSIIIHHLTRRTIQTNYFLTSTKFSLKRSKISKIKKEARWITQKKIVAAVITKGLTITGEFIIKVSTEASKRNLDQEINTKSMGSMIGKKIRRVKNIDES